MRESFMYGSVRGVARKGHSYRDMANWDAPFCLLGWHGQARRDPSANRFQATTHRSTEPGRRHVLPITRPGVSGPFPPRRIHRHAPGSV